MKIWLNLNSVMKHLIVAEPYRKSRTFIFVFDNCIHICKLILVIIATGVTSRLHYYLCVNLLLNITIVRFLKSGIIYRNVILIQHVTLL